MARLWIIKRHGTVVAAVFADTRIEAAGKCARPTQVEVLPTRGDIEIPAPASTAEFFKELAHG